MGYTDMIRRADTTIPVEYSRQIIDAVPAASAVLQLMQRGKDMSRNQMSIPVSTALPEAFVVGEKSAAGVGDGSQLIQTSKGVLEYKHIYAAKIGVIIPIPVDVAEDSEFDIFGHYMPKIVEAFGKKIDGLVVVGGADKPSTWPDAILTQVAAAAHSISLAGETDAYDAISKVMGLIEADGFMPNGWLSPVTTKDLLRRTRSTDGTPIFHAANDRGQHDQVAGMPCLYSRNGSVNSSNFHILCGAWEEAIYSIRKDMSFSVLKEASLYDSAGTLEFALAQEDVVGLKCVMRLGWQLPNPVNRINTNAATRLPFATMVA